MKHNLPSVLVLSTSLLLISVGSIHAEENPSITVQFESWYGGEGAESYETATIRALDEAQNIIWEYYAGQYMPAQCAMISDIGVNGNIYYFCENGSITALKLETGEMLWKNDGDAGSVVDAAFAEDGTLYACGYLGPDVIAISAEGETLFRVGAFSEESWWPYDIRVQEDELHILYEGGYMESEYEWGSAVRVDRHTAQMLSLQSLETYAIEQGMPMEVSYCNEYITLRSYASTSGDELARLPLGAFVKYVGPAENGFYKVSYEGQEGYALASYLKWTTVPENAS